MKLKELYKINPNDLAANVGGTSVEYFLIGAKRRLEDAGFEELSHGRHSNVYGHPNLDYVLKVFKKNDPAYVSFYNCASKNQDNPHFPKFRGHLMQIVEGIYAIRMEKLTHVPVKNEKIQIRILGYINECIATEDSDNGVFERNVKLFTDYLKIDLENKEFYTRQIEIYKKYAKISKMFPKLATTIELLKKAKRNHRWDIHEENFMLRGIVPVITDPFWN